MSTPTWLSDARESALDTQGGRGYTPSHKENRPMSEEKIYYVETKIRFRSDVHGQLENLKLHGYIKSINAFVHQATEKAAEALTRKKMR